MADSKDGKGDYAKVLEEGPSSKVVDGSSSSPPRSPMHQQQGGSLQTIANHPALPIFSYCAASILMTVTNKYVLSGLDFNLNFFLLCVQSVICVSLVRFFKQIKVIQFRDFNAQEAKMWFPISLLLVVVIYTGSKSLQFLSIPVYTIFKNLTIILIAYGEVLWFGGSVTALTLASFGLMVLSSMVAAWSDISHAISRYTTIIDPISDAEVVASPHPLATLNAGYFWMFFNCIASAAYVLLMRKRIKLTNFKDFDTMFYNNLLGIPVLFVLSILLEDWGSENVAKNFPAEARTSIIIAMVFSGATTVAISYTTAWCVRVTSSTTYSMVGALNKLPVAASGMIFFGDPVTLGSVSAVSVGFFAGIVYAVAKTAQARAKSVLGGDAGSGGPMIPMTNKVVSASSQSQRDASRRD